MRALSPTLAAALAAAGCASGATAPAAPPHAAHRFSGSPSDAPDPELAALERLAAAPFGKKPDRPRTMDVYLPDIVHWWRSHMFGVPNRQAFQYLDERFAVGAVWYFPARAAADDPDACITALLAEERGKAALFRVSIARSERRRIAAEHDAPRPEHAAWLAEADVELPLHVNTWFGALVATRSFPGTCLVQGMAVVATDHAELARRAVQRWVDEGAPRLAWHEDVKTAPPFDAAP